MRSAIYKNIKVTLIAVLAIVVLAACRPGTPSRYIQPSQMEDILVDYHIAQSMAMLEDSALERRNYDRTLFTESVLKKHGVTRAEFDSSLVYYYTRSDRFQDLYKRVARRLSDEALQLGASEGEVERYATATLGGDTASIWEGNRTELLMPYPPYNRIDFRQKADTSYHKGDTFLFTIMADFMYQAGTKDAILCFNVRLDNDSIVSRVNHVTVSGINQLRLAIPDSTSAKEIFGYIYLGRGNDQSATMKLLFLRDIQLIRFHNRRHEPSLEQPTVPQKANMPVPVDTMQTADPARQADDSLPARSIRGRRLQITNDIKPKQQ